MISLQKTGNAIKFTFDDNGRYLYNGTIEVPVNSLTLVTDGSDMFTFKKSATNDIFVSGLYSEIGMTKAELISFYKNNMVDSFINADEAQTMIDESISGKADVSAATIVNQTSGTVTGSTATTYGYTNITLNFAYNDGVTSFSGGCVGRAAFDNPKTPVVKYTTIDGVVKKAEIGSDTDEYNYQNVARKVVITMKGSNRLTYIKMGYDDSVTINYTYDYVTNQSVAASTYIEDTINPKLDSLDSSISGKADASATTVIMTESGTVDGSTGRNYYTAFTYSDGVYYLSGNSEWLHDNIRTFGITYSDGTNDYHANPQKTGDTDNYTFTISGDNFVFQAKGIYKIKEINIYLQDSETINYSYKYVKDVEKSVSAAILELDARVRALEEAQNNS